MKYLIIAIFSLYSSLFAAAFEKNDALIERLKQNRVRVVVLCNFQGTNNVMDIVTSSGSPLYELTNYGLALLMNTIPLLEHENITYICSTPAYRAQQTVNILGKAFNMIPSQLTVDRRLAMQTFGNAEGENYSVYKSHFDSPVDMLEGMPVNGEAGSAVFNRLEAFLTSLTGLQDQTVLVITHAFNYCHISKCLTGSYGLIIPSPGTYKVYDFNTFP